MRSHLWLASVFLVSSLAFAQPTFFERVDIGDYSLMTACYGEGTPSIIIDAGFGEPGAESGTWEAVIEEIQKTTQVCVYNRLGLGSSDLVEVERRTSQDVVDDLHNLLSAASIEGPYILVGHSFGGINVRLYRDQHPDDVVGMVLVDASHPQGIDALMDWLPPESPDEPLKLRIWRQVGQTVSSLNNREKIDYLASLVEGQSISDLGDLPLAVVTRSPTCCIVTTVPLEMFESREQVLQDLQVDLATLSTNSTHIIASAAGHYVHQDEPQLVIDAILHVLSEATK